MSLTLIFWLIVILLLIILLLFVINRLRQRYNFENNPCFHGLCTVRLIDGSTKFVKDIQRGDQLFPHGGTVNYVMRTVCTNRKAHMVLFKSGLMLTPWHPIRLNRIDWILPGSLVSSPTQVACEAMYSFALDQHHTIWVNNVECVTLGHGFMEDVVRHTYYGTDRVLKDLSLMDEQQNRTGLIEVQPNWIKRDKRTRLVHGIKLPRKASICP